MHETEQAPAAQRPTAVRHLERRPTIRDVAKTAGVSYGTVSRYLNGGKYVGETSARAITEAIARTGFRRNRHARSLATGKTMTVAFMLTEPQDRLFGDPNYPILLREVTSALAQRGFTLILMTVSEDDQRASVADFLAGHVDGVILAAAHVGDPIVGQLVDAGVPTVACGRLGGESRIHTVSADDRAGARNATAHLLATGRRRIAAITGPLDRVGSQERLQGYFDALDAANIRRDSSLIAEGDWSHPSGRHAIGLVLDTAPDIDGLFGGNDAMAAGAIATLHARGYRVPHDVAVVGFDDTGTASTCDPPLTTMRQPFREISREMVRILCDGPSPEPLAVDFRTRLIVRASAP